MSIGRNLTFRDAAGAVAVGCELTRIRAAIHGRRVIQFDYEGAVRVAEPHDYGVGSGRIRLFVHQLRGRITERLPGWRMIDVAGIDNMVVLSETFRGSRSRPGQAHKKWDELYFRVA